jgi:methionyl-tRNA formyltransferase
VVAYGALIPPVALDIPKHGWVNLHFSVLPAWRGAAPVQAALLHGDEVVGASTFQIEAGLDTGPVYGVVTEPARPRDTAGEVLDRLAAAGAQLLVATLDGIEGGTLTPRPQPVEGVCIAPKVTVADARVDWSAAALRVDRLVRACTPDPAAWTTYRGRRVEVGPVLPLPPGDAAGPLGPGELGSGPLGPGELRVERRRVLAGTGTTPVQLGDVRAEGRRAMPAVDWARGARPAPGPGARVGAQPGRATVRPADPGQRPAGREAAGRRPGCRPLVVAVGAVRRIQRGRRRTTCSARWPSAARTPTSPCRACSVTAA